MSVIQYTLSFDTQESVMFSVDTERRCAGDRGTPRQPPFWTELGHHRCPNCPIAAQTQTHCPAALDIEHIVERCAHVDSHAPVDVQVQIAERQHRQRTDVQSALRSLLGLVLATGGCPILSQLKGPGRLHMPFATVEETLLRMVGAYWVGQYIKAHRGQKVDFSLDRLSQLYHDVQIVNQHLKKRLDDAARRDANANAVVSLMSVAMLVSFSLDQQLIELEPFAIHVGDPVPPVS